MSLIMKLWSILTYCLRETKLKVLKRAINIVLLLGMSACVPSVSASWEWQAKDADELFSQGMRITELIREMHYEPENSASQFKDSYELGGRGFFSSRSNKIRVAILLSSKNNKLRIEISEVSVKELSPIGYEHYKALQDALNSEFGENNLVNVIYRGFTPPK